jgi:hypothetical protein
LKRNVPAKPGHRGKRKESPQENSYAERFNGTATRETLNGEDFHFVLESRVVLEAWGRRLQ